jgi:hypothetical protein
MAWRKVLPVAQLAAYLLLVWYGCWYRPTWQHWFRAGSSRSLESAGFYPTWIDGIEPVPEQLAAGLNFPAVSVAALSLAPFDNYLRTGASKDLAIHVVSAILIPLLWFLIGKRLDGRGRKNAAALKSRKALAVVALAALLFAASAILWFFAEGQRYTAGALSLAWIFTGIIATWRRLRQPGRFRPDRETA